MTYKRNIEEETPNPENPYVQRKSPRAIFHDYAGGEYFITICTAGRKPYFGYIEQAEMHLTPVGEAAQQALSELDNHYQYAHIQTFVVMPDHVHALISIYGSESVPQGRKVLGIVVAGLKQAVTRFARNNQIEFGWQQRFHDHIIRNLTDWGRKVDYIEHNVAKWDADKLHP
jgi:REP element-mobilizing transposase RayT